MSVHSRVATLPIANDYVAQAVTPMIGRNLAGEGCL